MSASEEELRFKKISEISFHKQKRISLDLCRGIHIITNRVYGRKCVTFS